jgi:hypothetical protein
MKDGKITLIMKESPRTCGPEHRASVDVNKHLLLD